MNLADSVIKFYKKNKLENEPEIDFNEIYFVNNIEDLKDLEFKKSNIEIWIFFLNYFLNEKETELTKFLNLIPKEKLYSFIYFSFCDRKRKSSLNSFYVLLLNRKISNISIVFDYLFNNGISDNKIRYNLNYKLLISKDIKLNHFESLFYFSEIAPYCVYHDYIFNHILDFIKKHFNSKTTFIKEFISCYYVSSFSKLPEKSIYLKDSLYVNLFYLKEVRFNTKYDKNQLTEYLSVLDFVSKNIDLNKKELLTIKKKIIIKYGSMCFNREATYRKNTEKIFYDIKKYLFKSNFIIDIINNDLLDEEFKYCLYKLALTGGNFKLLKKIHNIFQLKSIILINNIENSSYEIEETLVFDEDEKEILFFSFNKYIFNEFIKKTNIPIYYINPNTTYLDLRSLSQHKSVKISELLEFTCANFSYLNELVKLQYDFYLKENDTSYIDISPYLRRSKHSEISNFYNEFKKLSLDLSFLDLEYFLQKKKDEESSKLIDEIFK